MNNVNAPNCRRENDLVAFLYGELDGLEARTFELHLRECASCEAEMAALRDVRGSVVAWRNESLGIIASSMSEPAVSARREKPSALAAVREFFNLAPLWMKGAVVFASILFCVLAGLAVARLGERPQLPADTPQANNVSSEQLNALVERRVEEELQRRKTSPETVTTRSTAQNGIDKTSSGPMANRGSLAANAPSKKAQRPLSRTEREQLAADLRLISAKGDSDLDLLDDRINQ